MSMRKYGMGNYNQMNYMKTGGHNQQNYKNVLNDKKMHPVLNEGSVGEDVEKLQKMLVEVVAFYPSLPVVTIDGVFGNTTKNAVEEFQKLNSIFSNGIVDEKTWNTLYSVNRQHGITDTEPGTRELINGIDYLNESNNIISLGSQNEYVRDLQKYLNNAAMKHPSIPKVTVDGVFGPKTKEAVIQFQKLFNLTPDGIVGDLTWNALYDNTTGTLTAD